MGPVTNPSQIAIDPSFGITFLDRERNAGLRYTRDVSTHLVLETTLGYLRSTPLFVPQNLVQPAMQYGDGLYEPFNGSGGSITGTYTNRYQIRQTLTYTSGKHDVQAGGEARYNRDTLILGTLLNGQYIFGGGTAYSPVEIASASGAHNLQPGSPLPDSLTGFLTATPYSYTISVAPPLFAQGEHMGDAAKRRASYSFYIQDTWKVAPHFTATCGLRYEVQLAHRRSARQYRQSQNSKSGWAANDVLGSSGAGGVSYQPSSTLPNGLGRVWATHFSRLAGYGSHYAARGRRHQHAPAQLVPG